MLSDRDLVGGKPYSQSLMQDVFANGFGWITSDGDELTLGVDPQAHAITATNDANASSGSLSRNTGIITMFEHD